MNDMDIRIALRKKYCEPEWAYFDEVGQGTGANSGRFADAVAMNLWPSRGLEIVGIEIKVSKSDLKSEMLKPEKAEAIAKYCDSFWLVMPSALYSKIDFTTPLSWGINTVDEQGKISVVRKPMAREEPIYNLPKSFVAALLRRAAQKDNALIAKQVDARVTELLEKFRAEIKKQSDKELERQTRRYRETHEKIEAASKAIGTDFLAPSLWGSPEFITAFKSALNFDALMDKYNGIGSLVPKMRKIIEAIEKMEIIS